MARRQAETWPDLAVPGWEETGRAMQLWSQIVGKTRLALSPPLNHWWGVTLYVSARGLTTSPIPYGSREFEVEFDLITHRLEIRVSDGASHTFPLESGSVAHFYERYFAALGKLGIRVSVYPLAVEIEESIWLDRDETYREYDPEWAHRFFLALVQVDRILKQFRAGFLGKASPVHFFWGSFDLAVTRYSGRTAPLHRGGVPNCPDWIMQEAYSHEVSSAGFWPGGGGAQAAFYSYAYPEPEGFRDAPVLPEAARYEATLGEFVLPYDFVRRSAVPERELMTFLETTYIAAAELGNWDRHALERRRPRGEPYQESVHDLRM